MENRVDIVQKSFKKLIDTMPKQSLYSRKSGDYAHKKLPLNFSTYKQIESITKRLTDGLPQIHSKILCIEIRNSQACYSKNKNNLNFRNIVTQILFAIADFVLAQFVNLPVNSIVYLEHLVSGTQSIHKIGFIILLLNQVQIIEAYQPHMMHMMVYAMCTYQDESSMFFLAYQQKILQYNCSLKQGGQSSLDISIRILLYYQNKCLNQIQKKRIATNETMKFEYIQLCEENQQNISSQDDGREINDKQA
ncbi:unnamed protein product [Paramecium sonneborni]|uniref:Transmembrane protein n=1 Tax=Paramecium sonneborni TaxID=65129 RepID=A0A8S1NII4_9CILI|nr:unnamed protein product [Paramecium sonneborni]